MAPIRFVRSDAACVFIDLTEGPLRFVRSINPLVLRANAARLQKTMQLLGVPCVFAEAPLPEPLARWIPELTVNPESRVVHHTNDSFASADFAAAIDKTTRKQLLLCGIAADVGVALTALSAIQRGYSVAVLIDVVGSISERAEQAAFSRLVQAGAVLSTWSAIMGELQGDYTAPPGRELLALMNFGDHGAAQPIASPTNDSAHERGLAKLRQIAGDQAERPLSDWNSLAPDMQRYIVDFVAGDILSRPGLDAKTRQLATVAMLAARNDAPDEFRMHLRGALNLGWTRAELVEVLLQVSVFAGFPAALNALKWASSVFDPPAST